MHPTGILVLSEDRDLLLLPLSQPRPVRTSLHTPAPSIDLAQSPVPARLSDLTDTLTNLGGRIVHLPRAIDPSPPLEQDPKANVSSEQGGEAVYGLMEETKWAKARRAVKDKYCNRKWSQFDQLVGVVPPGGSLGLDNKVFSYALSPPRSSSSAQPPTPAQDSSEQFSTEYGILRFEHGATTYEYTDLRVNPRCLIESQLFEVRSTLDQLSYSGFRLTSLKIVFDGIPESSNILSVARSILPVRITSYALSAPPTPPQSPEPQTKFPRGAHARSEEDSTHPPPSPSSGSPTSPVSPTSASPARPPSTTSILSVLSGHNTSPTSGTVTQATSVFPTPPLSGGSHSSLSGAKLATALRLTAARVEPQSDEGDVEIKEVNKDKESEERSGGPTPNPELKPRSNRPGSTPIPHDTDDAPNMTDAHLDSLFHLIHSISSPLVQSPAQFYLALDPETEIARSWERATYEAIYPEWKRLKHLVDSRTYLAPFPQPTAQMLYLRTKSLTTRPSPLGMDVIYG